MQLQTMRDIWDQHARLLRVLQSLMQALKGTPSADGGGSHARLFDAVRAALFNIDDGDATGLRDVLEGMRWLERQTWTDDTVLFDDVPKPPLMPVSVAATRVPSVIVVLPV